MLLMFVIKKNPAYYFVNRLDFFVEFHKGQYMSAISRSIKFSFVDGVFQYVVI